MSNHFMGTSEAALDTNLRYQYLCALHLHLRDQAQTEHCMRSGENPKAERQYHPLTRYVFEESKANGGLGSAPNAPSRTLSISHVCVWQRREGD